MEVRHFKVEEVGPTGRVYTPKDPNDPDAGETGALFIERDLWNRGVHSPSRLIPFPSFIGSSPLLFTWSDVHRFIS